MRDLRKVLVDKVCSVLAVELGHTMASIDPPVYGPNTVRVATQIVDEGLLDPLTEYADEWAEQADMMMVKGGEVFLLLKILRDVEGTG